MRNWERSGLHSLLAVIALAVLAPLYLGACTVDATTPKATRGLSVSTGGERVIFFLHNADPATDLAAKLQASLTSSASAVADEWDRVHLPESLMPAASDTAVRTYDLTSHPAIRIVRHTYWPTDPAKAGPGEYVTEDMANTTGVLVGRLVVWPPAAAAVKTGAIANDGRIWGAGYDVRYEGPVTAFGRTFDVNHKIIAGGTFTDQ